MAKENKGLMDTVMTGIEKAAKTKAESEGYRIKQKADIEMLKATIGVPRPIEELQEEAESLMETFSRMGYDPNTARELAFGATFGKNKRIEDSYNRFFNLGNED